MSSIFISYRRKGSAGTAGRLYDTLVDRFGEEHVFMDVDSIELSEDFTEVLDRTLQRCRAVVVVVGPTWLEAADPEGRRRLDDPGDFVRMEIEHALASDVKVFPVLVDGATMPAPEDLPEPLRPFARKQALEITPTRYSYDSGRLVTALEHVVRERRFRRLVRWLRGRESVPWFRRPATVGALALALVAVAGFSLWTTRSTGPEWTDLPDLPVELEGAAAAAFDGRLWVAGGVSADESRQFLREVHVFDPETEAWSAGPALPRGVAFAALTASEEALFLLGGQESTGAVATVLRLDEPDGEWTQQDPLPDARLAGGGVWDGTRLVYAGGVGTDHRAHDEVYAVDEDGTWQTLGELQDAREKIAATSDGFGTAWMIGGRDRTSGSPAFAAVDVVEVSRVAGAASVSPVHSASAVWVPGEGPCVLGGDTGNGVTSEVHCLRAEHDLPALTSPRAGLAAAVLDGRVYVVGGYDSGRHGSATVQALEIGE